MKVSLKWINEFIEVQDFFSNPESLIECLDNAGLEVDESENQSKKWQHVFIGVLNEVNKHEEADKLTVCKVQVGADEHQIVCGAKNHKKGDFVVAALPGAILPGDFKIKKSKIRGVESLGMLCSSSELGLSSSSEGILILDKGFECGQSFASAFNYDDVIFDINVTPNRADCLSHIGIARELSILLDRELKIPLNEPNTLKISKNINVELQNEDKCPRYSGVVIEGVKVKPSADWVVSKLEAIDIKPINNIVDITNLVLFEWGQPLHAFDYAKLSGERIIISTLTEDTSFTTLDGTNLTINKDQDLCISDEEKPQCLAGVIGGKKSGVSDQTVDIFLEAAYFSAETVRKTSRGHGIETDSSYRFSRGVNSGFTLNALKRAAYLIQQEAGGRVSDKFIDIYPIPLKNSKIKISTEYISRRLGYTVDVDSLKNVVKKLGCIIITEDNNIIELETPAYRKDLNIKEDIVEEFARIDGYSNIPETFPKLLDSPGKHDFNYIFHNTLRSLFFVEKFTEVLNYSFTSNEFHKDLFADHNQNGFSWSVRGEQIFVKNPISIEQNFMRTSLVNGLLKNLTSNLRNNNNSGSIFEIGAVFCKKMNKVNVAEVEIEDEYLQANHLAGLSWGKDEVGLWKKTSNYPIFYKMKSHLENLFQQLGINSWKLVNKENVNQYSFIHPGRFAEIFSQGQVIGYIGELHPYLAQNLKIKSEVGFFEVNLDNLKKGQPKTIKYKKLSKFPAMDRRFSFTLAPNISSDDVRNLIKKLSGKHLSYIDIIDKFTESDGATTLTYSVVFQALNETLRDDDINVLQEAIILGVDQKLGVKLKGV